MIPEIVGENNFILIHIHGVQKSIDHFPLVGLVVDAAVFETADPFHDFLLGEHRLCHLGTDQADVQLLFLTFQFFHSLLGGGCKNTCLDCFQQIFKAFVTRTELFFDGGNHRILLSLYGNDGIRYPVNDFICEDLGHSLHNHRPFQPIPLECFPFAGMSMLGVDTFVVVIERSVSAFPAFTDHMAATSAAKHLSGQQVFFLCLGSSRGFLVCFHPSLHPFKYIFFNQCRNAARDNRVAIAVIPDIFSVFQKKRHGTCLKWPVKIVAQASCVQVLHNVLD